MNKRNDVPRLAQVGPTTLSITMRIMALAAVVSLLAVAMLVGCTSQGSGGLSASSSATGSSDASSVNAVAPSEVSGSAGSSDSGAPINQLVIETDEYTLVLPEEWKEFAEVSYGEHDAQVHLMDHSELPLLRTMVVDDSRPLVGGDIANGLFHSVNLPDGRRLEFWGTNWLYILGRDAAQHDGRFDYVGDTGKRALISLTYGKEVDLSDLARIGTDYYGSSLLEEYYSHMDGLVAEGLTMKVQG